MSQEKIGDEGYEWSLNKLARKIGEERNGLFMSLQVKDQEISTLKEILVRKEKEWNRVFEKKDREFVQMKEQLQRERDIRMEEEKRRWKKKINQGTEALDNMENKFRVKEEKIKEQMLRCEKELAKLKDKFSQEEKSMKKEIRTRVFEIQNLKIDAINLNARLSSECQKREKKIEETRHRTIDQALRELERRLFEGKEV